MGLDMYLGKINKKVFNNNKIDKLFSINNKVKTNEFENIKLINDNKIDELVEKVFTKNFYNEYISLKNASNEVLNKPYEKTFIYSLENSSLKTNKDRFMLIQHSINEYCNTLKEEYEYYNKNKKIFSSLEKFDLGYFRKHSDLHGYFEKLYYDRKGTQEFNCVKLILEKEDIKNVIEIAQKEIEGAEVVDKAKGFFWGESTLSDWEETLKVFNEILKTTDFETETVYYDSWW